MRQRGDAVGRRHGMAGMGRLLTAHWLLPPRTRTHMPAHALTLTMLLTARSLEVEHTATCTPLSIASSTGRQGWSRGGGGGMADHRAPRHQRCSAHQGPTCPSCCNCARHMAGKGRAALGAPLPLPHPHATPSARSPMRRLTPGRSGSAPVSIRLLNRSVLSSCSSLRNALRAAGSAGGSTASRRRRRQW